jgi:hypothetical protein
VVGFLSGGVKKSLGYGFLLSFIMLLLEFFIIQSGAFTDPNVAMTVILMMVLPFAALSAALGTAGSFLGRCVLKKALKS